MSFDTNPADEDPHGECANEIHRLEAELSAVRSQAQKDNLRAELADQYGQWLLDIGKLIGCGHLDERLPRCVEEEFRKLSDENAIMRESLELARQTDGRCEELQELLDEIERECGQSDDADAALNLIAGWIEGRRVGR